MESRYHVMLFADDVVSDAFANKRAHCLDVPKAYGGQQRGWADCFSPNDSAIFVLNRTNSHRDVPIGLSASEHDTDVWSWWAVERPGRVPIHVPPPNVREQRSGKFCVATKWNAGEVQQRAECDTNLQRWVPSTGQHNPDMWI